MRLWILAGMLVVASAGSVLAQEDAAFRKWCLPCHDAGPDAKIKLGPPLNGIDGRKAGTYNGYNYSDAMKNSGITWGEAVFKEYISNPMQKVGTAISRTDAVSAGLRPSRSPTYPKTTPPRGRTTKPEANTANVASSEAVGSSAGKKWRAMSGAKTP